MKANELQIGDYVNYRGQIIKVTSLYDKGGSNEVGWSDKESVWVNADNVEPIPLTPEIFVKIGFIKDGSDGWVYIHPDDSTFSYVDYKILWRTDYDNHLFIKKYKGSGTSATLQIIDINYVHQLQHALRLCGIEKEIIL